MAWTKEDRRLEAYEMSRDVWNGDDQRMPCRRADCIEHGCCWYGDCIPAVKPSATSRSRWSLFRWFGKGVGDA